MFENLARIGKATSDGKSSVQLMLDPMGSKYCLGVGLVFNEVGKFVHETIKHFSPEELGRVRYKKGRGANDFDPLAIVLDSGKYYNVADKLGRCCISWADQEFCSPMRKDQLRKIGEELRGKKDEWGRRLESLANEYKADDRYIFFYLASLEGGEGVPFYGTEEAEKYLIRSLRERYGTRESGSYRQKHSLCHLRDAEGGSLRQFQ